MLNPNIYMFNPQPDPPGNQPGLLPAVSQFSKVALNPQPLPPGTAQGLIGLL